jgi:hypothetical protein
MIVTCGGRPFLDGQPIQPPRQRPRLRLPQSCFRSPLTDTRGARCRARACAVRDAARAGAPISEAVLAGLRPVHLKQIKPFPTVRAQGGDASRWRWRHWSCSTRWCHALEVTIEEDRAEVERIAVSWQDVADLEQEAMLTRLGGMLEYLDPTKDAEYQLRRDAARLMRKIEASLGH